MGEDAPKCSDRTVGVPNGLRGGEKKDVSNARLCVSTGFSQRPCAAKEMSPSTQHCGEISPLPQCNYAERGGYHSRIVLARVLACLELPACLQP